MRLCPDPRHVLHSFRAVILIRKSGNAQDSRCIYLVWDDVVAVMKNIADDLEIQTAVIRKRNFDIAGR